MHRLPYTSSGSIYGPKEYLAYQTRPGSAFAVYKSERLWTIGHPTSGLSLDTLIPATFQRTRDALLRHVERLEARHPEECAVLATMDGNGANPAQREAAMVIRRTALEC